MPTRAPSRLLAIAAVLVPLVIALSPSPARGLEIESDLSMSRDFLYSTHDLRLSLAKDVLSVGAGVAILSDWQITRAAPRLSIGATRGGAEVTVLAAWAPAQAGRGWFEVEPRAAIRKRRGRAEIEGEIGFTFRRVDALTVRGAILPVDQFRSEVVVGVTVDRRWSVSLRGGVALYDRDLAARVLRGANFGPAISFAGRPERVGAEARVGRRIAGVVRVEAGFAGAVYADGEGGVLVPRFAIRAGPFGGFSVEPAVEIAVGVGRAAADSVRLPVSLPVSLIGGLGIGYER